MNNYEHVIILLNQKKEHFLELEQVTINMPLQNVDDMLLSMQNRKEILTLIDEVDTEIIKYSSIDKSLRTSLNHTCNKKDLNGDLSLIFDLSLSIKAIINRIESNNQVVLNHIELERDSIKSKLVSLNKSDKAAANKYYRSTLLRGKQKQRTNRMI